MDTILLPVVLADLSPALLGAPDAVITRARPFMDGGTVRLRFANGRGASVIRHSGSYGGDKGLFEVAVLDASDGLDYTTPITDDVLGWLTAAEVGEVLARIAELPLDVDMR